MSKKQIEEVIRHSLETYFKDLRGAEPDQLHDMMIQVMEKPLRSDMEKPEYPVK